MELNNHRPNNPAYALRNLLSGLTLLTKPGLRIYIAAPILFNLILYGIAFWVLTSYVNDLVEGLISYVPSWLAWLHWLIWPLFMLSFGIITFFSFTLLANLISSPFYGLLAEKCEKMIKGDDTPIPSEGKLLEVVKASVLSELKRISYFLLRAIPLLILYLIPGINLIAPLLWIAFSAWFIALEYTAYPLENHGILFSEQKEMLKKSRLGMISFGGLTLLGLTIPLFNILVPPAAVIGATHYLVNARKEETPDKPVKAHIAVDFDADEQSDRSE